MRVTNTVSVCRSIAATCVVGLQRVQLGHGDVDAHQAVVGQQGVVLVHRVDGLVEGGHALPVRGVEQPPCTANKYLALPSPKLNLPLTLTFGPEVHSQPMIGII